MHSSGPGEGESSSAFLRNHHLVSSFASRQALHRDANAPLETASALKVTASLAKQRPAGYLEQARVNPRIPNATRALARVRQPWMMNELEAAA
jgi:hypothetical protein